MMPFYQLLSKCIAVAGRVDKGYFTNAFEIQVGMIVLKIIPDQKHC